MNLMKALDCFCGKGGVSDGFALESFDVTGIDIVDAPTLLNYKHRFILADMLTLKGENFRGCDVIWGSPPCRDFSKMGHVKKWKDPQNPERGLILVRAFLNFVKDAKPRIWIMENVPYLRSYLNLKPNQISNIERTMRRAFWGNYPFFLLPVERGCRIKEDVKGKFRSWERAKIPISCSRAFARACKEKLEEF